MGFGFISANSMGQVIQFGGMLRNQLNFFLFIIEESYQTVGMLVATMYRRSAYSQCYEVCTYSIQELAFWCTIVKSQPVAAAIYPMDQAYLAFFRAELQALIDFRNKCAGSASGTSDIYNSTFLAACLGANKSHIMIAEIDGALQIVDLNGQGPDGTNYYLEL